MIGKVFALCDASEQAQFFNEAGKALKSVCDNAMYADMQLLRVADELDTHGKWFLKTLAGMLEEA